MSATVQIVRITGASGSQVATNITSINTRALADDVHSTNGTTNPVRVPTTGTNYSYWITTRLNVTAITGGTVDNIKWFTDGGNGFGANVALNVGRATSYVRATGSAGVTGDVLNTTNHAGLTGAPSNAFAYTQVSPLAVTGSTSTTGQFGDYVVYQFAISPGAASGASPQETITWQYDDTSS